MSKFTAGKWEALFAGELIVSNKEITIASTRSLRYLYSREEKEIAIAERKANARLMAAAPEMYCLLQIFADEPSDEEEREERINELCLARREARELLARIDSEEQEDK